MHRSFLYILGFLLIFSNSAAADDPSSYILRKEQRTFENLRTAAPYQMKNTLKLHPGLNIREKSFFPPLEDCNLYLVLPEEEKAQLTLHTGQNTVDLELPASDNGQILTLIIPEGETIGTITMPLDQEFYLLPGENPHNKTELTVHLDRPDEYILTIPPMDYEGQELSITVENRANLNVEDGYGDSYSLEASVERRSFHIPYFRNREEVLTLYSVQGPEFLSAELVEVPAFPVPMVRSGIQILNRSLSTWRNKDFEIYSWSSFPDILILDCLDYDVQNRFFRRLAFFVEKNGYKGTLLSNAQLRGKHAWNAHDYRPSDLAEFYNLVQERDFSIYPEEILLKEILINRGILIQNDDGILVPGKGAVLSISRDSSEDLRYRFFVHESSHGIYFTFHEYRDFVKTIWESLPEEDRAMWRFFLGWYGYDPEEEDLMINEFQAYLMQQGSDEAPGYFTPRLSSLAVKYPAYKEILERGSGSGAEGFQLLAEEIEDWLAPKWGLRAGNFFPLHKELH